MPRRPASTGPTRNEPAGSFFRHSGSRKIVFAVNERRSPADSTNGSRRRCPVVLRSPGRRVPRATPGSPAAPARRSVRRRPQLASASSTVNTSQTDFRGWRRTGAHPARGLRRRSRRSEPTRDRTVRIGARLPTTLRPAAAPCGSVGRAPIKHDGREVPEVGFGRDCGEEGIGERPPGSPRPLLEAARCPQA